MDDRTVLIKELDRLMERLSMEDLRCLYRIVLAWLKRG